MMPESRLVSVVTPVYNGGAFLGEAIESVLRQTCSNWEYVLVDNASTDETPAIIDQYAAADARIRSFRNEETLAYIDNWNRAVSLIDGRSAYCKIVHADDWLFDECLAEMVDLAEKHPSVGIVGSWIQRGEHIKARWEEAPGEVLDGRELARLSLLGQIPYVFGSPSALLLRSSLIRAGEPLYPRVDHPLVDQQLCYELLQNTDFGYVPRALSFNRVHDASITAGQEDTNEWFVGKLTLLSKYGPEYLLPDELEERIDHYLDRYYRFLAKQVGRSRGAEFWSYHADSLEALGLPLVRSRLWREALSEAPRRLRNYVSRRSGSSGPEPREPNESA
jgi:glycosyltransferase involved in cell wall biosynthesis